MRGPICNQLERRVQSDSFFAQSFTSIAISAGMTSATHPEVAHSAMITLQQAFALIPLIESGVVDNSRKRKHRGKVVSSFAVGSRLMYDFIQGASLSEGGKPIIAPL